MRIALPSVLALALLAAPAAQADQSIVAGPNSTYLTTNVTMDQGEPLTFHSFDVPSHDVSAHDKGPDGKPLFSTPLIGGGESAFVEGSQYLTSGSYAFLCTNHANMHGTLTVSSAGTPAKRPGAGDPADAKKPGVSVKIRSGGARAARRSGSLQVEVSVDEAAKVGLKATARASGKKVTIATGSVKLTGAGKRQETLKLTKAGKRALRSRAAVTVTATATDSAGNTGSAKASRTLK